MVVYAFFIFDRHSMSFPLCQHMPAHTQKHVLTRAVRTSGMHLHQALA